LVIVSQSFLIISKSVEGKLHSATSLIIKSKISKPSSQTGSSQVDISQVKSEDVSKLTPSQKNEWVRVQAERERNQTD
jgi:hypothetical protein